MEREGIVRVERGGHGEGGERGHDEGGERGHGEGGEREYSEGCGEGGERSMVRMEREGAWRGWREGA